MRWWDWRNRELTIVNRVGHRSMKRYPYRVLTTEGKLAVAVIVTSLGAFGVLVWRAWW